MSRGVVAKCGRERMAWSVAVYARRREFWVKKEIARGE
jgi:hypothetical protein